MMLSICLFLITLFISIYQAYVSIGSNIVFAEQEIKGNAYQRPVAKMLLDAGDLRVLAKLSSTGVTIDAASFQSLTASINEQFSKLKEVNAKYGVDLQFTDEGLSSRGRENLNLNKISDKWKKLESSLSNPAAASDDDFASLIVDLRGLIAHSGDTSNLILDPDLDSYYLMDVTLIALPQTLDRQTVIATTLLPQLVPTHQMSGEEKIESAVMSRLLKEGDVDRVAADMDTSFKEDPNFYGVSPSFKPNLNPLFESYTAKNKQLYETLAQIALKGGTSQKSFLLIWNDAHQSAYDMLKTGYDELDTLLDRRIQSYKDQQQKMLLQSFAGILISLIFYLVVLRSLTRPLNDLTMSMGNISQNQLDTAIGYTESKSEIGRIAKALEVFKQNALNIQKLERQSEETKKENEVEHKAAMNQLADMFEQQIVTSLDSLLSSSQQMGENATIMENLSQEVLQDSIDVSSSAEQAESNVFTVASATEELSSSSAEISRQVGEVSRISSNASNEAQKASQAVTELNEMTESIGSVVLAIREIAEQTNLLALNATIEAARAGELGKGFAVVADEVKKLAVQTATKTEEIQQRVTLIQGAVEHSVLAVKNIITNVAQIDGATSSVSAAVEEQYAATEEIGRNVNIVSANTQQVAQTINHVKESAIKTGESAKSVLFDAQSVKTQVETLKKNVLNFLMDVRED
jgi:methyl-accepting chemotaxis protein